MAAAYPVVRFMTSHFRTSSRRQARVRKRRAAAGRRGYREAGAMTLIIRKEATSMRYVRTYLDSPVGRLELLASDAGLAAVLWPNDRPGRVRVTAGGDDAEHPVLVEAGQQLREYFDGRRTRFELPLVPEGTPFQRLVWEALRTIPYGETRSYAEIASQIGRPKAVRAVGAANGRNPLSIVTPCHRVVGANGALTGFAGGLEIKACLLALEQPRESASSH
jgi:methylated-DNA-[protein]-cysteine S-methyltransferase